MSDTAYWIVLAIALTLASYSIRQAVSAPVAERAARGLVLVCSAVLGVLLGGWALGWDSWPAGMVGGLAVIEFGPHAVQIGPTLVQWVRGRLGVKGGKK